jgi:hypothetical protein
MVGRPDLPLPQTHTNPNPNPTLPLLCDSFGLYLPRITSIANPFEWIKKKIKTGWNKCAPCVWLIWHSEGSSVVAGYSLSTATRLRRWTGVISLLLSAPKNTIRVYAQLVHFFTLKYRFWSYFFQGSGHWCRRRSRFSRPPGLWLQTIFMSFCSRCPFSLIQFLSVCLDCAYIPVFSHNNTKWNAECGASDLTGMISAFFLPIKK